MHAAELERRAQGIARRAHTGQTDKAGRPYIEHVQRVVAALTDPRERAVAWLHDVIEDTPVTAADLRAEGFPEGVVAGVVALTHRPGEPRSDYYARVRADPLALAVKEADLADNADPERLAVLDPETRTRLAGKYRQARTDLGLTSA